MTGDEERRKDWIDLGEIKVDLAVVISELHNKDADLRRLDEERIKHDGYIRALQDQGNRHYGAWMVLSALIIVVGYGITNFFNYHIAFPHG